MDTTTLFREHGPFVWRVLRRLGVSENDTADACQEVFVVVHKKLAEFERRSSVRTWLYGIAVRVASDHRRRVRRRRELVTDVPPELLTDESPDDTAMMREARALLDGILDTLDDDKRAVFVLYEIEQLAMNDVATAIGCPLQTAYSRLHAARDLVQSSIRKIRQDAAVPS
ncbi:MAG: sigma-70 family RNA polymerase sigma factor [Myxococcales bacterium]|nr:sigma-70 family RNA polymerase sigma factor [Myxococcales bacterium]